MSLCECCVRAAILESFKFNSVHIYRAQTIYNIGKMLREKSHDYFFKSHLFLFYLHICLQETHVCLKSAALSDSLGLELELESSECPCGCGN